MPYSYVILPFARSSSLEKAVSRGLHLGSYLKESNFLHRSHNSAETGNRAGSRQYSSFYQLGIQLLIQTISSSTSVKDPGSEFLGH
eukprot:753936-Hanusia_phi.AAC.5